MSSDDDLPRIDDIPISWADHTRHVADADSPKSIKECLLESIERDHLTLSNQRSFVAEYRSNQADWRARWAELLNTTLENASRLASIELTLSGIGHAFGQSKDRIVALESAFKHERDARIVAVRARLQSEQRRDPTTTQQSKVIGLKEELAHLEREKILQTQIASLEERLRIETDARVSATSEAVVRRTEARTWPTQLRLWLLGAILAVLTTVLTWLLSRK